MPKLNYSRKGRVSSNPFRAQVRVGTKEIYLGSFPSWNEAKEVEDEYRRKKNLPAYKPQMARIKERV